MKKGNQIIINIICFLIIFFILSVLSQKTYPKPSNAACYGKAATIVGTDGDDIIDGTPNDDVIAGKEGNDVIDGLSGNDIICGDNGDDTISGGDGFDILIGGEGDDNLNGGKTMILFRVETAQIF